jgi:hypothetical protein
MENRTCKIEVRLTEEERQSILFKMNEIGVRNMSAYIRKMAIDGYCINLDLQPIKEVVRLLRYCSNNLNQYAKRAHETGSIYETDIEDLKARLEEIWEEAKEIIIRLGSIS